jgi:hypothetical protein
MSDKTKAMSVKSKALFNVFIQVSHVNLQKSDKKQACQKPFMLDF